MRGVSRRGRRAWKQNALGIERAFGRSFDPICMADFPTDAGEESGHDLAFDSLQLAKLIRARKEVSVAQIQYLLDRGSGKRLIGSLRCKERAGEQQGQAQRNDRT